MSCSRNNSEGRAKACGNPSRTGAGSIQVFQEKSEELAMKWVTDRTGRFRRRRRPPSAGSPRPECWFDSVRAGSCATSRWPPGERPRQRVILVLAPLSSTNTSRAGLPTASRSCQCALFSATSGRSCSAACSVFFIGQPQLAQPQIHRRSPNRAVQARAQLGQRRIGLRGDQSLQAGLAPGTQQRLAPAQMGLWLEGAALLELLPNPAHGRHAKPNKLRDVAGAFALFVELDDSLAHRQGMARMPHHFAIRSALVKLHH